MAAASGSSHPQQGTNGQGSPAGGSETGPGPMITDEEKEAIDSRSIYVGNVSIAVYYVGRKGDDASKVHADVGLTRISLS